MPRTPSRLCCQRLREAAVRLLERGLSVEEAAAVLGVSERSVRRWAKAAGAGRGVVATEKSAKEKAGGGGAAGRREAAERPGTPPVDNVWVAILRRRQLDTAGGAVDENAG